MDDIHYHARVQRERAAERAAVLLLVFALLLSPPFPSRRRPGTWHSLAIVVLTLGMIGESMLWFIHLLQFSATEL